MWKALEYGEDPARNTATREPKDGANRSCLVALFGHKFQLTISLHQLLLASLSDQDGEIPAP